MCLSESCEYPWISPHPPSLPRPPLICSFHALQAAISALLPLTPFPLLRCGPSHLQHVAVGMLVLVVEGCGLYKETETRRERAMHNRAATLLSKEI
eukprot:1059237-Rhodomonas_salina.1